MNSDTQSVDFDHPDFDLSDVEIRDAVAYVRSQPGIAAAMGLEPGQPRTFRGDPVQIWTATEAVETLAPTLEAAWHDVRGRWIRRVVGGRAVVALKMRDGIVVGVYGEQATWRILREDNARLGVWRSGVEIRGDHKDLIAFVARLHEERLHLAEMEARLESAQTRLAELNAERDAIDALDEEAISPPRLSVVTRA